MDLNTVINNFTGNNSIIDRVSASVAQLNGQAASFGSFGDKLPGMGAAGAAAQAAGATAMAAAQAMMSKFPIALPAMKAVHLLEKKIAMAAGGISSTNASPSFGAYFNTLPAINDQITSAFVNTRSAIAQIGDQASLIPGVTGNTQQERMASLAAIMPPPTIPNPANPAQQIPNPAYTAFMNAYPSQMGTINNVGASLTGNMGDISGTINNQVAAANGNYANGITRLKALSFASFCAADQPAAVQKVIDDNIVASNIPEPEDLYTVGRTGSKWSGIQTKPKRAPQFDIADDGVTVAPKPVVDAADHPTTASPSQLAAIGAQIDAEVARGTTASRAADAASATLTSWMSSVNYAAIKNNASKSPEDQAAYDALKAQATARPDSIEMKKQYDLYNVSRNEVARLRNIRQYMLQTGPYPGNPNGPW